MPDYKVYSVNSVRNIPREIWDKLANPPSLPFDPFLSYDFFLALEESGSASDLTGWGPLHLVVEVKNSEPHEDDSNDEAGEIVGIMPLYSKTHSKGEYIFDHGWAEGFDMVGGRYYPKLLCAIPLHRLRGGAFLWGGQMMEQTALLSPPYYLMLRLGIRSWVVIPRYM